MDWQFLLLVLDLYVADHSHLVYLPFVMPCEIRLLRDGLLWLEAEKWNWNK